MSSEMVYHQFIGIADRKQERMQAGKTVITAKTFPELLKDVTSQI